MIKTLQLKWVDTVAFPWLMGEACGGRLAGEAWSLRRPRLILRALSSAGVEKSSAGVEPPYFVSH